MNAHGTSPGPSRIAIEGQFYNVVPLVTLESRCFYGTAEVTYPATSPGWATAVVEAHAVAAWFEAAS